MHQVREAQSLAIHQGVAERLMADPEPVIGRARANLRRWIAERGEQPTLLEWLDILEHSSPATLAERLVSDDPEAVRLRQSSPFAGVLGPREIWRIKRSHAPA